MIKNSFNGPVKRVTNIDGVGLTADFDRLFGSSGKDRTVSVRLPDEYVLTLRRLADHENKGMGEYIRAALKLYEWLGPLDLDAPYDPSWDLRVLMINDRELHHGLIDIYRL